jgi:hypothetical protein
MRLEVSTIADVQRISDWTQVDEYHRENNVPAWWLTGNGSLAFRLDDDEGPVVYIRVDEGDLYRLHCQFAPRDVVSKRRLISSMMGIFPWVSEYAKSRGAKGVVFNSGSPSLARFMKKLGFEPSWEKYGDYVLKFEEN